MREYYDGPTLQDLLSFIIPFPFGRDDNGKWHKHSYAWDCNDDPPIVYCACVGCSKRWKPWL